MTKKPTYRTQIYELGAENFGVVTIDSAAAVGVPAVELRKLAQRKALIRSGRGVYRIPFFAQTQEAQALEAVKLVGENAFLSGESVLSLLNLGVFNPAKFEVSTPNRIRKILPNYITFRHCKFNEIPAVEYYQSVPCQPVYEAFQQVAVTTIASRFVSAIDEAYQQGYLNKYQIQKLRDLVKNR